MGNLHKQIRNSIHKNIDNQDIFIKRPSRHNRMKSYGNNNIWDILALHRIVFSLKKTIVCNFRVNMLAVPGYYGMHFVKRCHYPIKNFTEPVIYITLYKLLTVIQGFLALILYNQLSFCQIIPQYSWNTANVCIKYQATN